MKSRYAVVVLEASRSCYQSYNKAPVTHVNIRGKGGFKGIWMGVPSMWLVGVLSGVSHY